MLLGGTGGNILEDKVLVEHWSVLGLLRNGRIWHNLAEERLVLLEVRRVSVQKLASLRFGQRTFGGQGLGSWVGDSYLLGVELGPVGRYDGSFTLALDVLQALDGPSFAGRRSFVLLLHKLRLRTIGRGGALALRSVWLILDALAFARHAEVEFCLHLGDVLAKLVPLEKVTLLLTLGSWGGVRVVFNRRLFLL